MSENVKIGVFGGTFDPCTEAHYAIVKKVLADKLVDKVIVVPSIVNYYRASKDTLFSNEERLKILNVWFANESNVYVDDYEYLFARYHSKDVIEARRYIDTLKDIKHTYEDDVCSGCDIEWRTIIGGDSLKNLKSWHRWEDILAESKLIVVARNNEKLEYSDIEFETCIILEKFANVSATDLRRRLVDSSQFCCGTPLEIYLEKIESLKKEEIV